MKILFKKEISENSRVQIERLKEWYKRLDYFWGTTSERDEIFELFNQKFSTCPVCKGKNDKSLLIDLYFSTDPSKKYIREHLIRLMNLARSQDSKINIGLPCCECFKELYGTK